MQKRRARICDLHKTGHFYDRALIAMVRLNAYYRGMALRKDYVDLWLRLTIPVEARRFIHEFDWNCPPEWVPDKVCMDSGKVIWFEDMSDEEAVIAAMEILRSVQIPQEMRERQIKEDLGEIH